MRMYGESRRWCASSYSELARIQRHSVHMRFLFAFLSFSAALAAQVLVTVPNGYEGLEGTSAARTPFGWSSGRVQYLVDGAQLCPNVALITSLRMRLDGGNFNVDAPVAKTFTATIDAYEVPIGPSAMSATFALNVGTAVPVQVFSGTLMIPATTRVLPYPNPWTLDIPLTTPLIYTRANGNLLLDITVVGSSGDNWPADGFFFHATEPRGEATRIWEDAACASPSGSLSIDVPAAFGNGAVGSALQVTHTATPAAGAVVDLVYQVLGFDNRQSGGVALPTPLSAVGAPLCSLHVDPFFGTLSVGGFGSVSWQVPLQPELVGVPVFVQAAGLDGANNQFVPSKNAWQIRLGNSTPNQGPAQMVHRSNYTTQTTGSLSPTGYYGLVMGFVGSFL